MGNTHLSYLYGITEDIRAAVSAIKGNARQSLESQLRAIDEIAREAEEIMWWAPSTILHDRFNRGFPNLMRALNEPLRQLAGKAVSTLDIPKYEDEEKPWNTIDLIDIGEPCRAKAINFLREFLIVVLETREWMDDLFHALQQEVLNGLRHSDPAVRLSAATLAGLLDASATKLLSEALQQESDPKVQEQLSKVLNQMGKATDSE